MLVPLWSYSSTQKMPAVCSFGTLVGFQWTIGVIAKMTKLFITAAVRNSNLKYSRYQTEQAYFLEGMPYDGLPLAVSHND
jgi:hypothetical protein